MSSLVQLKPYKALQLTSNTPLRSVLRSEDVPL